MLPMIGKATMGVATIENSLLPAVQFVGLQTPLLCLLESVQPLMALAAEYTPGVESSKSSFTQGATNTVLLPPNGLPLMRPLPGAGM